MGVGILVPGVMMSMKTIQVLLVESDQDDYVLIKNLLAHARGSKFELQWVQDFEDARHAIIEADYDVCLLDDREGSEDALDLVHHTLLNKIDAPLITLTNRDERSLDVSAMRARGWDYLLKSQLTSDLLERSIRYAIGHKSMEVALRHASLENTRLDAAVEHLSTAVLMTDPRQPDNPLIYVNPAFTEITGYEAKEVLGRNCRFLQCPESNPKTVQAIREAIQQQREFKGNILNRRKDGTQFWNKIIISPVFDEAGQLIHYVGLTADVTEMIQTREKRKHLAAIVEGSNDAIISKNLDGIITTWNQAAERMYGYSAQEMSGQSIACLMPPELPDEWQTILARLCAGEHLRSFETVRRHKNGELLDIALTVSPLRDEDGRVAGASVIAQNITRRKQQEMEIERQILRIQSLRAIDMAITSSLDLRVTLNVLLDQVTTHLAVDSAAVLLQNTHTQRLEYSVGRGFRTTALQRTHLRVGEGYAGRAALERRTIHIPNFLSDKGDFARAPLIAAEGFISYFAIPLIAKGRVAGVLEIFHRAPLQPSTDWLDFMETLAGQAAIAIDNAALFDDLQFSNLELQLAYDSTLEGWSRALDLRDKETEGHSQRVTEGTLTLARAMCVPEADLIHIRRGALLHDIGKMGIPDSILLKPGPLSDEEWVMMKKHPTLAYELLSPIHFLRAALDIPYCHHEKWDGSGYPRGIKGEQIPICARIFAVVDVWDALSSDRPYRAGWPADRVRAHIAQGSGTHFDPRVVEVFLNTEM